MIKHTQNRNKTKKNWDDGFIRSVWKPPEVFSLSGNSAAIHFNDMLPEPKAPRQSCLQGTSFLSSFLPKFSKMLGDQRIQSRLLKKLPNLLMSFDLFFNSKAPNFIQTIFFQLILLIECIGSHQHTQLLRYSHYQQILKESM